jgi:hypothetical protein
MNAEENYRNIDAMMLYMNEHHSDQYIFKYSTPSDYVDAIAKHNVTWPTKQDDGFPYSNSATSYWTGYFTTRPNLKQYARRASREFYASNQLYSVKALDQKATDGEIEAILAAQHSLLDKVGILQHHDAITGTDKQAVADDYAFKLS